MSGGVQTVGMRLAPDAHTSRRERLLDLLQAITAGVATLYYSGGTIPLGPRDPDAFSPDPVYALLSQLMLLTGLIFLVRHRGTCVRLAPLLLPFAAIVLLAASSALWSQDGAASFRRSISLGVTLLQALTLIAGLGMLRLMRIVVTTMTLISLLSVALAIAVPSIGRDVGEYANAIRGVYSQKNGFGIALLDASLALSFVVLQQGRWRLRDMAQQFFFLVLLVWTRSTTSLLLTLILIGTSTLCIWLVRGGPHRMLALFVVLGGLVSAALLFGAVGMAGFFDLIGKDSSLTGRTEIWEAVRPVIAKHHLLGYGYSAFWLPDSPEVQGIWWEVGWKAPTAHSGYLDIQLQLGMVGLVLTLGVEAISALLALRCIWQGHVKLGVWFLMFVGLHAIIDRTESGLVTPDERMLFWICGTLAMLVVRTRQIAPLSPARATPSRGSRSAVAARAAAARHRSS